jgi:translation initiation factor 3 subunit D
VTLSCLQLSGGVEWRQKLDTQRGAVLANELRNNACKLAKWTVQALLAGSDQIKFGYVELLSVWFDFWLGQPDQLLYPHSH